MFRVWIAVSFAVGCISGPHVDDNGLAEKLPYLRADET